ncbi:MAG: hypothetical protein ABFC63_08265 [Thermoguttaceae bacterium]
MVSGEVESSGEQPVDPDPSDEEPLSWRLAVVIGNAFLMFPFAMGGKGLPFCSAKLGGFWDSYFLVFGAPTTLLLWGCPDRVRANLHGFQAIYIVNFVIVSYLLGWLVECVGKWFLAE